jgi:Ca2+-binding RTX toxin-like protein
MYGADFTTNSGNTTYRWDANTGQTFIDGVGQGAPGANRVFLTLWDGGGVDTYDFSNYGTNLQVDLSPGGWSLISSVQQANLGNGNPARGNVFNALQHNGDARSLIENASGGTGHDTIGGNVAANHLTGGVGNDRLIGRAGNDTLDGGAGTDTAVYSGARGQYNLSKNQNGSVTVADLRGGAPDGTDIAWNMELYEFTDGVFTLDQLVSVVTPPPPQVDTTPLVQPQQEVTGAPYSQSPLRADIARFFDTANGSHFYTASAAERDSIITNLPHYRYEGNAFDTTATAATGDDVFRFFNTSNGTHFYTVSEAERDSIIANLPHYKFEGTAYYAYETNVGGAHEELYRFFRADNGTHFFTTSEAERDNIMASLPHYRYEGIAYYVDLA